MPCCSTNRSQRSSAITSIRLETERQLSASRDAMNLLSMCGQEPMNSRRLKLRTLVGNFGCNLRLKNWETVADNLREAGWSLGYVSAIDREGRTIWITDAHRDDGKRFIVS